MKNGLIKGDNMNETWDQTKQRLKETLGIAIELEPVEPVAKPRYDEAVPEVKVALYEVRKVLLPVDPNFPEGKVVVSHVTKQEADWWIENKLKAKSYIDDVTDSKTLVFYEKFLIGASPKQRSIYFNPAKFCTEEFPELKLYRKNY